MTRSERKQKRLPPLGWLVFFAITMWLLDMWLSPTVLPSVPLLGPTGTYIVSGIFGFLGIFLMISAAITLRRAQTTVNPNEFDGVAHLVTHGVYRISRNPIYLGMLLLLVGEVILLQSPWLMLAVVAFIWIIDAVQIQPEEAYLMAEFPDEFRAYASRTRRWL